MRLGVAAEIKPDKYRVALAIDQGGCAAASRPTTHSDPIFVVEAVTCCCVGNMPGAVPITSTKALTNATLPFIQVIADHGLVAPRRATRRSPAVSTFCTSRTCAKRLPRRTGSS